MKKRCFVCHKKGYWSSKYSRKECDELRKKFKDRLNRRFNRHAKQYITKYEGIDYDDELDLEFTNNAMEALIIDTELPLFLTQE